MRVANKLIQKNFSSWCREAACLHWGLSTGYSFTRSSCAGQVEFYRNVKKHSLLTRIQIGGGDVATARCAHRNILQRIQGERHRNTDSPSPFLRCRHQLLFVFLFSNCSVPTKGWSPVRALDHPPPGRAPPWIHRRLRIITWLYRAVNVPLLTTRFAWNLDNYLLYFAPVRKPCRSSFCFVGPLKHKKNRASTRTNIAWFCAQSCFFRARKKLTRTRHFVWQGSWLSRLWQMKTITTKFLIVVNIFLAGFFDFHTFFFVQEAQFLSCTVWRSLWLTQSAFPSETSICCGSWSGLMLPPQQSVKKNSRPEGRQKQKKTPVKQQRHKSSLRLWLHIQSFLGLICDWGRGSNAAEQRSTESVPWCVLWNNSRCSCLWPQSGAQSFRCSFIINHGICQVFVSPANQKHCGQNEISRSETRSGRFGRDLFGLNAGVQEKASNDNGGLSLWSSHLPRLCEQNKFIFFSSRLCWGAQNQKFCVRGQFSHTLTWPTVQLLSRVAMGD